MFLPDNEDMEFHDFIDQFKGHPQLITQILREKFASTDAALYPPDAVSPEYSRFCEALALPEPPYVLVLPDHRVSGESKTLMGYYTPKTNLVVVGATIFQEFQKDEPFAQYVVAHELGHAKTYENPTRRQLLKDAMVYGGSGLAFAGSYGVSTAVVNQMEGPDDLKKRPWRAAASEAAKVAGAGGLAWLMHKHIKAYLVMDEEFQADDFAAQVMARPKILHGIQLDMERQLQRERPELLAKLEEKFDRMIAGVEQQQGQPVHPERKQLAWVKALAAAAEKPKQYGLGSILKPNYYPTVFERFARLHQQEQRDQPDGLSR